MSTAYFYNTSKKKNSTFIPTGGTSVSFTLKAPCSILSPVLRIDRNTIAFGPYNYCYIPDFNRYYFVGDVELGGPVEYWTLRVDELASFKTAIGAGSHYILRSASASNGTFIDNMYPIKGTMTRSRVTKTNPFFNLSTWMQNGYYSVGIAASGTTSYYLFSAADFASFMNYIMSDQYCEDVVGQLQFALNSQLKMIVDPLQYITSVIWIPINCNLNQQRVLNHVQVGFVSVAATAYEIIMPLESNDFTFTSIPRHPEATTRGSYCNLAPFSEYSFFCPPFGMMNLDSVQIATAATFYADIRTDIRTGSATLTMRCGTTGQTASDMEVIGQVKGQLGIPVQLSQVRAAGFSAIQAIGAVVGVAASAASGNVVGVVSGTLSAIDTASKASVPSANTIGTTGSWDSLVGAVALQCDFYGIGDEDVTELGRPLCEVRQINTLSGYILCANVDLSISGATEREKEQIKNYMESGFFYE